MQPSNPCHLLLVISDIEKGIKAGLGGGGLSNISRPLPSMVCLAQLRLAAGWLVDWLLSRLELLAAAQLLLVFCLTCPPCHAGLFPAFRTTCLISSSPRAGGACPSRPTPTVSSPASYLTRASAPAMTM